MLNDPVATFVSNTDYFWGSTPEGDGVTAIIWVVLNFLVCSVVSTVSPAILYLPVFCPSEKFLPTNQTNTYITLLTTNKARQGCLFLQLQCCSVIQFVYIQ